LNENHYILTALGYWSP